jgi:hypothetical protein
MIIAAQQMCIPCVSKVYEREGRFDRPPKPEACGVSHVSQGANIDFEDAPAERLACWGTGTTFTLP